MVLKNSDMMTEDDEVFNCGSEVTCVSCHGLTYEGEIIAYDHGRRVMVIRCPSSLGQHSDVHLINLNNTTDVKVNKDVKKENTNSNPTSHLDTRKVLLYTCVCVIFVFSLLNNLNLECQFLTNYLVTVYIPFKTTTVASFLPSSSIISDSKCMLAHTNTLVSP